MRQMKAGMKILLVILIASLIVGGVCFAIGFNGGREMKQSFGRFTELGGEISIAVTYLSAAALGLLLYRRGKQR